MNSFELINRSGLAVETPSKPVRVVGIDLGTTNSTVAEVTWTPGEPPKCRTLELDQPTREGIYTSPLVPSVVTILADHQMWVGEGAKRLRTRPQETNLIPEVNLFYETKNDMGLRKSYFRATEPFNHASKIAGHILSFLKNAAIAAIGGDYKRLSVSVPASFQLNQRRDTLMGCQYAALKLEDDDLVDEPTAALIDYLITNGHEKTFNLNRPSLILVFDFGGGTCDVSVLEVKGDKGSRALAVSQIAISRYHRLGGGDIDAAIVHECLLPAILQENKLSTLDLTWAQKKKGLEPQLLGTAEALKIALCRETDRLIQFDKYKQSNKSQIVARQPSILCHLGERTLRFSQPALSATQFEKLLEPFFDKDFLYARETEFGLTQSVFAPLKDALDRAGRSPEEIDFCLMVGGSSLIPQVRQAIQDYFPKDRVDFFRDPLLMQTVVARGAAWNAMFKELFGHSFIQPVLHDAIGLVTTAGDLYPLVPSRCALPYPPDKSHAKVKLLVPKGKLFVDELRFEVVGQAERQVILNEIWRLPEKLLPGTEITMEYCVTAGKQFQCRAYITEDPATIFEHSVENPLVNIVNPNEIRQKIEEKEEELRKDGGGGAKDRDDFVQLARWYGELNQKEKALDYLRTALNKLQKPDVEILNLQGICFGELGDHVREEKAYTEADKATSHWDGPLFNLTLSCRSRGLHQQALDAIDKAIKKVGENGPNLTLKAMCLESLKETKKAKAILSKAISIYEPPKNMCDWELGWYYTAAKLLEDKEHIKKAEKALKSRNQREKLSDTSEEVLRPSVPGNLVVRR
jgi:molecular chaperone DnaK